MKNSILSQNKIIKSKKFKIFNIDTGWYSTTHKEAYVGSGDCRPTLTLIRSLTSHLNDIAAGSAPQSLKGIPSETVLTSNMLGLFQWLPLASGGGRRERFALSLWRRVSPKRSRRLPPPPAAHRR